MKHSIACLFAVSLAFSAIACSSAASDGADDIGDEAEGTSEEAVTATDKLAGAWTSQRPSGPPPGAVGLPFPGPSDGSGPPPGAVGLPMPSDAGSSGPPPGALGLPIILAPKVKTIVFTKEPAAAGRRKFYADVDTGLRPVCRPGGPCISGFARVVGEYKATTTKLTLTAAAPTERGGQMDLFFGSYTYAKNVSGITLTKQGQATRLYAAGCEQLVEGLCQAAESCSPIMGPSSCHMGRCTRDFVFKGCESKGTETVKGTMTRTMGIGGENTGYSLRTDAGLVELVLDAPEKSSFVDGRVARVTGARVSLSGVETGNRSAIDASQLLVCPAPGTYINLMPPVASPDTYWLADNCPGVNVAH